MVSDAGGDDTSQEEATVPPAWPFGTKAGESSGLATTESLKHVAGTTDTPSRPPLLPPPPSPPRMPTQMPPHPELTAALATGRFSLKAAWITASLGLVGTVITAICSVSAAIVDQQDPEPANASTCVVAYRNVKDAVDMGISSPALLDNLNRPGVDAECGREVDIAREIAP